MTNFTSQHKRHGNAAIRMIADGISLEAAAKYLNVEEPYLRQSVLFARINIRMTVKRKTKGPYKGYWLVGDTNGGILYPASQRPQTLRDKTANRMLQVALDLKTDDLDRIFSHWFRQWEKGEFAL